MAKQIDATLILPSARPKENFPLLSRRPVMSLVPSSSPDRAGTGMLTSLDPLSSVSAVTPL